MTLLEVPTGSKNAPNRFSVKFYPKWDVRPPFSQKIFIENRKNRKNLPGRLRNPSRKKNRDLNRISLTLSNQHSLISAYSPTLSNRFLLRLLPSMHDSTGKRCSVGWWYTAWTLQSAKPPSRSLCLPNSCIMCTPEQSEC